MRVLFDCLTENILPFFFLLAATKNLEAKTLKGLHSVQPFYLRVCVSPLLPLICLCETLAEKSKYREIDIYSFYSWQAAYTIEHF